jgi:hypothetical protein
VQHPDGLQVTLQASTDLVHWASLPATNQVHTQTNTLLLTDPAAAHSQVRFYRAVVSP